MSCVVTRFLDLLRVAMEFLQFAQRCGIWVSLFGSTNKIFVASLEDRFCN